MGRKNEGYADLANLYVMGTFDMVATSKATDSFGVLEVKIEGPENNHILGYFVSKVGPTNFYRP